MRSWRPTWHHSDLTHRAHNMPCPQSDVRRQFEAPINTDAMKTARVRCKHCGQTNIKRLSEPPNALQQLQKCSSLRWRGSCWFHFAVASCENRQTVCCKPERSENKPKKDSIQHALWHGADVSCRGMLVVSVRRAILYTCQICNVLVETKVLKPTWFWTNV